MHYMDLFTDEIYCAKFCHIAKSTFASFLQICESLVK